MASMQDRTVVVVGGHSGFGEAISRTFAADGATVVIAARRTDVVDAVADEVGGIGLGCDITDDAQVRALVDATVERTGRLDVFVNCAGYEHSVEIADLEPDDLAAMHAVQIQGAMYCIRHAGNAMRQLGNGGAFASISSLTAQNPARDWPPTRARRRASNTPPRSLPSSTATPGSASTPLRRRSSKHR